MLVHVKAPPTSVEISGPDPEAVLRVLRAHFEVECEDDGVLIPVDELPWYKEAVARRTQGSSLRIRRTNAKLTLQQLSDKTGIAKGHLSAMELNKRPIGRRTALKLAAALGCDYRSLL